MLILISSVIFALYYYNNTRILFIWSISKWFSLFRWTINHVTVKKCFTLARTSLPTFSTVLIFSSITPTKIIIQNLSTVIISKSVIGEIIEAKLKGTLQNLMKTETNLCRFQVETNIFYSRTYLFCTQISSTTCPYIIYSLYYLLDNMCCTILMTIWWIKMLVTP